MGDGIQGFMQLIIVYSHNLQVAVYGQNKEIAADFNCYASETGNKDGRA